MSEPHELVLILDFGSQYTQLIARRIRELGVYCEVLPFHAEVERIRGRRPKGLILSGGPDSVYDDNAPKGATRSSSSGSLFSGFVTACSS